MKEIIDRIRCNKRLLEIIRYAIFGFCTSIVNISIYQFLLLFFDYKISNVIAILVSKLFAYVTNKMFVFHSRCDNLIGLLHEMLRFTLARGATGLFDYFGLIFAVDVLHLDKIWAKYVIIILVIILNYFLGKKTVFINEGERNSNEKNS